MIYDKWLHILDYSSWEKIEPDILPLFVLCPSEVFYQFIRQINNR